MRKESCVDYPFLTRDDEAKRLRYKGLLLQCNTFLRPLSAAGEVSSWCARFFETREGRG